jgi:LacI family transcriptional regulator, galactose operon repressor
VLGARCPSPQRTPDIVVIETDAPTIRDGREAGARIAGMPPAQRPTAVLCANDLLALGLLTEALQLGLNVPADLAIVGYDDIEFAAAAAVPLTSVRQPRPPARTECGGTLAGRSGR